MPYCSLLVDGADHDVSNLVVEGYEYIPSAVTTNNNGKLHANANVARMSPHSSHCTSPSQQQRQQAGNSNNGRRQRRHTFLTPYHHRRQQQRAHAQRQRQRQRHSLAAPLYPNLADPCNRRLVEDLPQLRWEVVPLGQPGGSLKDDERHALDAVQDQMRQHLRLSTPSSHHSNNGRPERSPFGRSQSGDGSYVPPNRTTRPERAQTAPLHDYYDESPVSPSLSPTVTGSSGRYPQSPRTPRLQVHTSHSNIGSSSSSNQIPNESQHPHRRSLGSALSRPPTTPRTPGTPRTPQRHSLQGDISSASGGLRPRVNYKALYGGRRRRSGTSTAMSSSSSSCNNRPTLHTSITSGSETDETMMSSRSSMNFYDLDAHEEETPVPLEYSSSPALMSRQRRRTSSTGSNYSGYGSSMSSGLNLNNSYQNFNFNPAASSPSPEVAVATTSADTSSPHSSTIEIAPNVRVPVRASQESYAAVQSGNYTVGTCFACTSTLVCTKEAAYVLCPDCHVVSPLMGGSSSPEPSPLPSSDTKKEDPYGVGTGLKREWVADMIAS